MAYITRANFKRISFHLNEKQYDGEQAIVCEEIPQIHFEYFNKSERQALQAFKEFVLHPEIILNPEYHKLRKVDTKTYVFESVAAYHCDINCEKLNQDFNGILLPDKIKEQGDEKIEEFRQWYKDNLHFLEEDKSDIFGLHLYAKYGIRLDDIGILNKKNSGSYTFDNYSLEDICNQIVELTKDFKKWLLDEPDKKTSDLRQYSFFNIAYNGKCAYLGDSSYKNTEHIDTINSRNKSRFTAEEIRDCLYEAQHKFKIPMIDLLKKYYMIKYNADTDVAVNVLESLGFKPCSKCYPTTSEDPLHLHRTEIIMNL